MFSQMVPKTGERSKSDFCNAKTGDAFKLAMGTEQDYTKHKPEEEGGEEKRRKKRRRRAD